MKSLLTVMCLLICSTFVNAQHQKLVWTPWNKVPLATKEELKKIKYDAQQSVYSQILLDLKDSKELESSLEVSIAIIDLDGDGKPGYAVGYSGSMFCGSGGCQFSVYENGGKARLSFNDDWEKIRPAKNGVISSAGKFFELKKVN